jgi:hypothetical protein
MPLRVSFAYLTEQGCLDHSERSGQPRPTTSRSTRRTRMIRNPILESVSCEDLLDEITRRAEGTLARFMREQ